MWTGLAVLVIGGVTTLQHTYGNHSPWQHDSCNTLADSILSVHSLSQGVAIDAQQRRWMGVWVITCCKP